MADYGAEDAGSPNAVAEMRAMAQRCFKETEMLSADDDAEGDTVVSMYGTQPT